MSVSRQGEVACLPLLSCVGRDYSSASKYQTLLLTIDAQMPGILIKSQFRTVSVIFGVFFLYKKGGLLHYNLLAIILCVFTR